MGLRDCVSVIFIQMDSFEFFLKHAKNLFAHLSKLLYSAWICNGKNAVIKSSRLFLNILMFMKTS